MNKIVEFGGGQDDVAGDADIHILRRLLDAVDREPTLTQRRAASELGIALGLANAYFKRCIKKGYIKIREVPASRYAYYLTPQGFAEKARLTRTYLAHSFTFFRNARLECRDVLDDCAVRGWTRVVLAGNSDLTEIMVLCAAETSITMAGIVDPRTEMETGPMGLAIARDYGQLEGVQAVVVTDLDAPQATYEHAAALFSPERVLAPRLLCIVPCSVESGR